MAIFTAVAAAVSAAVGGGIFGAVAGFAARTLLTVGITKLIANRAGKTKRSGRFTGRRNNTRRAFVCLKSGQEINFTEEAK